MSNEKQLVADIAQQLQTLAGVAPSVFAVLGSGWKEQAESLISVEQRINLADINHWLMPAVAGHGAELVVGQLIDSDKRVAFITGRVHAYEGYSGAELVRGVRAMIEWGANNVLLLNAAGSLSEDMPPGTLMPLTDHINYSLPNPLAGGDFVDLVDMYHPEWRAALLEKCPELTAGIYAACIGPSYETPAEVAMLQKMGANAVGMSTIPEAIAAHAMGARVMAISMMTNLAAGIGGSRPNHQEVLDTARNHAQKATHTLQLALNLALN
ncbi:MAG TPA: purine-nucleoside phosphorylase [Planctomycetes bacterium]|nr:purine-nucleoside phosphorylase [Planctomycetota bacterium]